MPADKFFLGVDGGGTGCRARLCDRFDAVLGEGSAGPANLRLGNEASFDAVLSAANRCLATAGLDRQAWVGTAACIALAGASEPGELAAARRRPLPFRRRRPHRGPRSARVSDGIAGLARMPSARRSMRACAMRKSA